MVDVTVQGIVLNTVHTHLWTQPLLDYRLIQSSETGSSVAMKKEGLRRSLNYLLEQGVSIVTIATDRQVFHSLLLKYCPKRQHFSYIGMRAHIELAILDHNYNTNRKQAITKKGMLTFRTSLM